MPAYYASIKALDALDKKSIQEMKSFSNPPQVRNGISWNALFRHHNWRPKETKGCLFPRLYEQLDQD